MLRVFATLAAITLSLAACGPSADERKRIASRACGEILETRKFESSKRASLYNDAVDQIGLNGLYWSAYSDTLAELKIMSEGSWGAKLDCQTSLLQGNTPFVTD